MVYVRKYYKPYVIRQIGIVVFDDGISCVYIFYIYNYPCLPIGYVLLVIYVYFLISYKYLYSSFVYTIGPYLLNILYVKVWLLPNYETCFSFIYKYRITHGLQKQKKPFLLLAIWYGENSCKITSRINTNRYWWNTIIICWISYTSICTQCW